MEKKFFFRNNPLFRYILFLLFLVGFKGFSQTLPTFSLTVTATNETCSGNGALSFSVSGNDTSATMTYYVYKAPDYTNATVTTTSTSVTGLTSGTYRVTAVQSKSGSASNSQTWNGTIANNIQTLTYTTASTNVICGNDGVITVTRTGGTLNTTNPYSLYNSSGTTLVAGPQVSNSFTGLAAGTYLVSVKDSCGQNVTQTVTVTSVTPNVNFLSTQTLESTTATCSFLALRININPGNSASVINYPINIQVTTYNSSNAQVAQTSSNVTAPDMYYTSSSDFRRYEFDIPYLTGTTYNSVIRITDACGNVFSQTHTINNPTPSNSITKLVSCSGPYFRIFSTNFNTPITYNITGPSGFSQTTTVANSPYNYDLEVGSSTSGLATGNYTITATDACGHTKTTSYNLTNTVGNFSSQHGPGCAVGMVNIGVNSPAGVQVTGATLTAYPTAYSGPTTAVFGSTSVSEPFNVKENGNRVIMNNVPSGTYTFAITDACGVVRTHTITTSDVLTHGNLDIQQTLNCGSFDIVMNVTGSNSYGDKYYLQYYNASNTWETVQELINNTTNGSFTKQGQYRIRKVYSTKGVNSSNPANDNWWYDGRSCEDIVKTFTYTSNQISFGRVYGFACSDGVTYNLYASAQQGVAPYTFQIVEKSGDPSFVPVNPTSTTANDAFFTALTSGVYKL